MLARQTHREKTTKGQMLARQTHTERGQLKEDRCWLDRHIERRQLKDRG